MHPNKYQSFPIICKTLTLEGLNWFQKFTATFICLSSQYSPFSCLIWHHWHHTCLNNYSKTVTQSIMPKFSVQPAVNYKLDMAMDNTILDGLDELYDHGRITKRAPAKGDKTWCFYVILTSKRPRDTRLPALYLLTNKKSDLSLHNSESWQRCSSNFSGPTRSWFNLAMKILHTSLQACGNATQYHIFPAFGKKLPPTYDSLLQIQNFLHTFMRLTILHYCFTLDVVCITV